MPVAERARGYEELPDLLTAGQVSEIMNVSTRTVYSMFSRGDLPGVKVGGTVRINKRQLLAALGIAS